MLNSYASKYFLTRYNFATFLITCVYAVFFLIVNILFLIEVKQINFTASGACITLFYTDDLNRTWFNQIKSKLIVVTGLEFEFRLKIAARFLRSI